MRAGSQVPDCAVTLTQATHETLFDPPLPAAKAKVIASMGFGVINKVYIVSDAPEKQVPVATSAHSAYSDCLTLPVAPGQQLNACTANLDICNLMPSERADACAQERADKATAYNLMWSLPAGPDSWPESPAAPEDGPAWLQVGVHQPRTSTRCRQGVGLQLPGLINKRGMDIFRVRCTGGRAAMRANGGDHASSSKFKVRRSEPRTGQRASPWCQCGLMHLLVQPLQRMQERVSAADAAQGAYALRMKGSEFCRLEPSFRAGAATALPVAPIGGGPSGDFRPSVRWLLFGRCRVSAAFSNLI